MRELLIGSNAQRAGSRVRVAVVVSHPIQYYVPLYRRLANRSDVELKVFFTWHNASSPQVDRGFRQAISWDLPLLEGYSNQLLCNHARSPGTHHFWGIRCPDLIKTLAAFRPDVVHLTGYAYASHLALMWWCHSRNVPLLLRGDSHLLDRQPLLRGICKRMLLRHVFRWPKGFLCVGKANRSYYTAYGAPKERLFNCPHSIEVSRFSNDHTQLETQAYEWRQQLGLAQRKVLLFAGKFERKKRPVALMKAFLSLPLGPRSLLMVGDGELAPEVKTLAGQHPDVFRVLGFQNQSRMPLVYRLGDAFVLPSAYGETWGLAVNEALACGRPALVSANVGCSLDVIRAGVNGQVFRTEDWDDLRTKATAMLDARWDSEAVRSSALAFDIPATEEALINAITTVLNTHR